MKKPEKKKKQYEGAITITQSQADALFASGYNKACDEYEKWLPSEEEITLLVNEYSHNDKDSETNCNCDYIEGWNSCRHEFIKVISERIRG